MADELHIQEIEEQAALYALDALADEEAVHFRLRLDARCGLCDAEVRKCEAVVTALPLGAQEVAPPPGLRSRVLAMAASEPRNREIPMGEGTLIRASETEWVDSRTPGVQFRKLHENKTMLVKMAPNTSFPGHEHAHEEHCLVLEGSISSDGVTAYAGDFTYMPRGSSHAPLHSKDGCLLLLAYM